MRRDYWIVAFATIVLWPTLGHSEDLAKEVKKAVERSTLDEPGTTPFHLKATLEPSFERDKESGRTGEVEIWWASPSQMRREVRSPAFRQTYIVDGIRVWEKNEGNYFPEWLRETAVELIKPVPPLDQVLEQVKTAEVRRIGPMTHLSWITVSGTTEVRNILRSSVALQDSTGVLLYASGFGWGAEFKEYKGFHGRAIARTVNVGSPEVTAKVTTLEDLRNVPAGFFDTTAQGGDPQPLQTVLLDETSLRKNLLPTDPLSWPPLQDGPLEGNVTTQIVIDREGTVREIGTVVSENSGVNEVGRRAVAVMRFKPFLINGVPVQAMSQVTIPFKTVRPTGADAFESARTYFERARQTNFPAAGAGVPYVLRAEVELNGNDATTETGRYEDTWLSETLWRREAWFGKNRYLRSRTGDNTYQLAEGPDPEMLRLVLKVLEPIPAIDTFVESDWRIKRDTVNGVRTVRVLTGYESPEGKLDPEHARGYWFDDTGLLLKTYFQGVETQRSDFVDFAGVKIARRIDVLKDGKSEMKVRITEVSPAGPMPPETFEEPGHEWVRAFTDEVR